MTGSASKTASRECAWLSQGLEELIRARTPNSPHYDVVVVGSGYGGAIVASELAGNKTDGRIVRICVLERGKEYLPGMFPSRMSDLAGHVRFSSPVSPSPRGERDGLFDVRVGPDVCAVVANGLGGGSLINAGVMEIPKEEVFDTRWPEAVRKDTQLRDHYLMARRRLGGGAEGAENNIFLHQRKPPPKYWALERLGTKAHTRPAAITVAMTPSVPNYASIPLTECTYCGDCVTGCNHGAKDSLDTNLLVIARRKQCEIYTGATVLRLERDEDAGWCLEVVHTDEKLRDRQGRSLKLKAHNVILAAGTFGSPEILLRSTTDYFKFSRFLGRRFSGNGDMIAAVYDESDVVNMVADEGEVPIKRGVGPTITGIVDLPETTRLGGIAAEEMAVPGPLRRLLEEVVTTANTLHLFETPDRDIHLPGNPQLDPCAVDRTKIRNTAIVALMGDDGADGALELVNGAGEAGDGAIRVRWPELRDHPLFAEQLAWLEANKEKVGGRIFANPMWRLLPDSMEFLLDAKRGPALTVHPLGGCPMADSILGGAVDDCGRVFNPEPTSDDVDRVPDKKPQKAWYKGLVVLDGSIVPTALGTNPALTIAALALRAAGNLRKDWNFTADTSAGTGYEQRPRFCAVPVAVPAAPTKVEVLERMVGEAELPLVSGKRARRIIELTLRFEPKALDALMGPIHRTLEVAKVTHGGDVKSQLRIFDPADWQRLEYRQDSERDRDAAAQWIAPLTGTLAVLDREASTHSERRCRTLRAWFFNRGLRDTWQWLAERARNGTLLSFAGKDASGPGAKERLANALALASRGGEVRRLDYELEIGRPTLVAPGDPPDMETGNTPPRIRGAKKLTYARRSNPWRQLQEMTLSEFPGMNGDSPPVLKLDQKFLARRGVPLLRIASQQDQPSALVDLACFAMYLVRLLLNIHIWSFRKPDPAGLDEPQRLPGILEGVSPSIKEIDVDQLPDGTPVRVRLTHYARSRSPEPPLVVVHGYSTSSTTYGHHSLKPSLAGYFLDKGRDVWLLDLRTSCGMPTARWPWAFEDAAYADIPAAIDFIVRETGQAQVDVFAHCIGAAMLGMAVLDVPEAGARFARERDALPGRIRKAVLSQVGPVVVYSPANIFRAYAMSYIRQYLPMAGYSFRTGPDPSLPDQILDRLLATLPYPEEEFDLENPWWPPCRRTPFVGTRRRMDALYGRDFSLRNVDAGVLKYIDDLFGPLNTETVAQTIHFAHWQTIMTRAGRNPFVSRENLRKRWKFSTLSIHGDENGLTDVATLHRMEEILGDAQCALETKAFEGYGHQDCLIGKNATKVFDYVESFLAKPAVARQHESASVAPLVARVPWLGPTRGLLRLVRNKLPPQLEEPRVALSAAASPVSVKPMLVALVPVVRCGDYFCRAPATGPGAGFQDIEVAASLNDPQGWLRLDAPVKLWQGGCDGVLMVLIHDEPTAQDQPAFPPDLFSNPLLQNIVISLPKPGDMTAASPTIADLVPRGPLPIPIGELLKLLLEQLKLFLARFYDAIELLLEQRTAHELMSGLIELNKWETIPSPQSTVVADRICFAVGSCQYPYGIADRIPADASFRLLSQRLDAAKPKFLLLVGDQIYVDATAGLFDPTTLDDQRVRPYERLLESDAVRGVLRRLPAAMIGDDHEIGDNWEPRISQYFGDAQMEHAREAYLDYQRGAGPARVRPVGDADVPLWFTFEDCEFPFFVADTRTERTSRMAKTVDMARIMSDAQWDALRYWLTKYKSQDVPKFIISSSILLPRRLATARGAVPEASLHSDAWDGYPRSMHRLLALIAANQIQNVVFLSGDEHLSCVAHATILDLHYGHETTIQSIHCSPLYAPYPFANAIPADLAETDAFPFEDPDNAGRKFTCTVSTKFGPAGDGFALISAVKSRGQWQVDYDFVRP